MFENESNLDQRFLAVVLERFFTGVPVSVDPKVEGYKIRNGEYVLGCMAGPSCDMENLFHEMSHLAEREISKLIERPYVNWGYGNGKYWEAGNRFGFEPQTDQSVRREARVWAFQLSLQNHFGLNISSYDTVRAAYWLDAFPIYARNEIPDCQVFSSEGQEQALRHLADWVEKLSREEYTFEKFCSNWNERMIALSNKTKSAA